jgi:hypothetical protein
VSLVCDLTSFVWTDHGFVPPHKDHMVLYEVHPASFGARDGEPLPWRACIPMLPHLAALGINVINLLPTTQDRHDVRDTCVVSLYPPPLFCTSPSLLHPPPARARMRHSAPLTLMQRNAQTWHGGDMARWGYSRGSGEPSTCARVVGLLCPPLPMSTRVHVVFKIFPVVVVQGRVHLLGL